MSSLTQTVKDQIEKGLRVKQDSKNDLIKYFEEQDIDVKFINLSPYLIAANELLSLRADIFREINSLESSTTVKKTVFIVEGFDISPWFSDATYQLAPSLPYSWFDSNSKNVQLGTILYSIISQYGFSKISIGSGPFYMRGFEKDTRFREISSIIAEDLFASRTLGKWQRVVTSIAPSAYSLAYSVFKKQDFLNCILNAAIGNVWLTQEVVKNPLLDPPSKRFPPNAPMNTEKKFPKEPKL